MSLSFRWQAKKRLHELCKYCQQPPYCSPAIIKTSCTCSVVCTVRCVNFPSLWLCLISVRIILQCMQRDLRQRSLSAWEVTAKEQTLNPFDREFGIFLNKTETDGHRYITDIWSYIHIVFSFKSLRKCFVINDWYPKGLLWAIILTTEAGR